MSIVAVVLVGYCLAHPIHDFVEYWTAAHLLTAHQNPYSLGEVFTMERQAGFEQSVPIMLLSPPWALPLIAPIGLINSYALGCLLWMIVLIAAVASPRGRTNRMGGLPFRRNDWASGMKYCTLTLSIND